MLQRQNNLTMSDREELERFRFIGSYSVTAFENHTMDTTSRFPC
jgi:hypothetical protein